MKKLTVLSLFDGMSCGRIALDKAGVKVKRYYSSEIKDYAILAADANYPTDIKYRLGDVTKIKKKHLPKIDLLIGGSPCQDFSQANSERIGLDGVKSGLFYEYLRLLKKLKPKYFLLENVRMKQVHQDLITKLLGVEPYVINSSKVVPHLRHRLYWTNIPFNNNIEDTGTELNNHLTKGYSDRKKARTLLVSDSRPLTTPIKMVHRYFNTGFTTLIFKDEKHFRKIKKHFDDNFKGKSAKEIDLISLNMDLSLYDGVRYLTKDEREICQSIPAGYTHMLSDNQSACLLGDGWTVEIIANIFKGLK